MHDSEYLVGYGPVGEFARFRSTIPCRRGERVVVRHELGLELGVVLCPVGEGHLRFLSSTAVGELLRRADVNDEQTGLRLRNRADALFNKARALVNELTLPMTIVDVAFTLDGQRAIVSCLRGKECDYRPLVSALARQFDVQVVVENLALPKESGCGKPGCGQAEGGGCSTCGTGGCSSCGAGTKKEHVEQILGLFAMPEAQRTSLL